MTPLAPGEPSLPDKVISIHDSLTAAKIPHAVGGALALAYYAEPRATIDIDLNIFVPPERWPDVIEALAPLGIETGGLDSTTLERDGQCRLWWGDNAVDLFFDYDPIHSAMPKKTRQVPFADTMLPIVAPEHLAVFKAMFDRPKDWLDIEQILVATDELDLAEIEGWLEKMAGRQDPRLKRFAELKAALAIES